MTTPNPDPLDLVVARACGSLNSEAAARLDQLLSSDPALSRWRDHLDRLIQALPDLRVPAPPELQQAISNLISAGVPDDPWAILWHCASQWTDSLPPAARPFSPSTMSRFRDAASLESAGPPRPLSQIVRDSFAYLHELTTPAGVKVFVASPAAGFWIVLLLSSSSVPLGAVPVTCLFPSGQQTGRTDRRGTFALSLHDAPPSALHLGPPVSATLELQ